MIVRTYQFSVSSDLKKKFINKNINCTLEEKFLTVYPDTAILAQ